MGSVARVAQVLGPAGESSRIERRRHGRQANSRRDGCLRAHGQDASRALVSADRGPRPRRAGRVALRAHARTSSCGGAVKPSPKSKKFAFKRMTSKRMTFKTITSQKTTARGLAALMRGLI